MMYLLRIVLTICNRKFRIYNRDSIKSMPFNSKYFLELYGSQRTVIEFNSFLIVILLSRILAENRMAALQLPNSPQNRACVFQRTRLLKQY